MDDFLGRIDDDNTQPTSGRQALLEALNSPNGDRVMGVLAQIQSSASALDPEGLFGKQTAMARPDLSRYITKSAPKGNVSDLASIYRLGRTTKHDLAFAVDARTPMEGVMKGISNAVSNTMGLRERKLDLADRNDLMTAYKQQQATAEQAAEQEYQNKLKLSQANYDAAINHPAYGATPEERQKNAERDAANGWGFFKKLQEAEAGAYGRESTENRIEMETFGTRRKRFQDEHGFDPFSEPDMKRRRFTAAQINAFRQLFPGKEFADELTTMQRNLQYEQGEANLEGTRKRTERLQQTPIPQPRPAAPPKKTTSKAAQVQEAYEAGDISEAEYKQWLLGTGKGGRAPVEIPSGRGFSGAPSGRPAAKPSNRVQSFTSKYGF